MEDQHKRTTGMMSHLRKLSVDIGARPSTSDAERLAARYIEQSLRRVNLEPEHEKFTARRNPSIPLLCCYLIMTGSVLLYRASPIAFTVTFIGGLLLFLLELMGKSVLGSMQWHFPSGNVVARITPYQQVERKVVLLAHLDTHREAFYQGKRWSGLYRIFVPFHAVTSILTGMWLVVITGATILKVDDQVLVDFWRVALALTLPTLIAFLAVLSKGAMRRYARGADDDASGLAVMINLAHHYSQRTPSSTEIWLVALGCEDVGAIGLKRFLQAHRAELKGAAWIILDGLGREKPVCYRREGLFLPFHANRSLLRTAEDINKVYPHYGLALQRSDCRMGSCYRLLSQGRKALTFSSRPAGDTASTSDNYDGVDPKDLQANYAFVLHYLENIDKKGFSRRRIKA
jgi:hypothetical protein